MSKEVITITNLSTGEVTETKLEIQYKNQRRYGMSGQKAYSKGIIDLIIATTKGEALKIIAWHNDSHTIGKHNMFTKSFISLTLGLHKNERSKFKRKLIENDIILQYGTKKRLMLNPFIFFPRDDKDTHNSQYLDQQSWLLLVKNKDRNEEEVKKHIHMLFEA